MGKLKTLFFIVNKYIEQYFVFVLFSIILGLNLKFIPSLYLLSYVYYFWLFFLLIFVIIDFFVEVFIVFFKNEPTSRWYLFVKFMKAGATTVAVSSGTYATAHEIVYDKTHHPNWLSRWFLINDPFGLNVAVTDIVDLERIQTLIDRGVIKKSDLPRFTNPSKDFNMGGLEDFLKEDDLANRRFYMNMSESDRDKCLPGMVPKTLSIIRDSYSKKNMSSLEFDRLSGDFKSREIFERGREAEILRKPHLKWIRKGLKIMY